MIKKGTKQGDPLSSLLCNAVLQTAFKEDIPRWQKKTGMGICLGDNDHDCLTNMRVADDVLLFASSKRAASKNALRISSKVQKRWRLRIHPGKTKILSNQNPNNRKEIEIDNIKVEMLTREESTKYLGQMIIFQQQETTEIRKRIRAAWATFRKYRQELTSKSYLLGHRLRLFDIVVSPTMNHASGTWTLTKEPERMIQSTQRKMLRLIIQTKRKYRKTEKREDKRNEHDDKETWEALKMKLRDGLSSNTNCDQYSDISFKSETDEEIDTPAIEEEEWIDCVKTRTDEAIEKMKSTNIRCWIKTHKRMKWRLTLRIASLPGERWIVKVAEWNPELSSKYKTYRAIGRPRRR